jgi:hypothetical protein
MTLSTPCNPFSWVEKKAKYHVYSMSSTSCVWQFVLLHIFIVSYSIFCNQERLINSTKWYILKLSVFVTFLFENFIYFCGFFPKFWLWKDVTWSSNIFIWYLQRFIKYAFWFLIKTVFIHHLYLVQQNNENPLQEILQGINSSDYEVKHMHYTKQILESDSKV